MSCDRHICAQCRTPIAVRGVALNLSDHDGPYKIGIGYDIADGHKTPDQLREIARQMLDAADEAERRDGARRQ